MTTPSRTRVATVAGLALLTLVTLVPMALGQAAPPEAPATPPTAPAPATDPVPAPVPEPVPESAPAPAPAAAPEPESAPAPVPAPVPAPESAPATAPAPAAAPEKETSDLVPPEQAELMAERALKPSKWAPGKGLSVATEDKAFSLTLKMRVQMRYELAHDNAADEDPTEMAFMVRRARIQLKGNVFGEHNKYYLQLAVAPRDMDYTGDYAHFTPIRNFEISFDYLNDLVFTLGQMKKPFNRQRVISSGDLQMVDRSTVTAEFNIDRDVGFMLSSDDLFKAGYLRYRFGIFNGEGRDGFEVGDTGFNYVGRIELHPMGSAGEKWDYDEVDFERLKRPRLSLGVSYAYNDRAHYDRGSLGKAFIDEGTANYHHVEADLMLKWAGLSLTSEFHFRDGSRDYGDAMVEDDAGVAVPAPQLAARNGVGYYIQAGYLLPRLPFELSARWAQILESDDSSLPDSDEIAFGFGWYVAQHSLKFQTDYARLRADSYDAATQQEVDEGWGDSTDLFRVQAQLAF